MKPVRLDRAGLRSQEEEAIKFGRREFLRLTTLGCAYCLAAGRTFAAENHAAAPGAPAHWSYEGDTGPEHWGMLQPDFKTCQLGLEQTPIDLAAAVKGEAGVMALDYKPLPLRIVNNGHTIQVNADAGCAGVIGGTRYDLLQFHFHHPSEHLLSGKRFDLECHFVHRSSAGDLAVVGVFIRPGEKNIALQPIWDAMPRHEGPEMRTGGSVNPAALLPKGTSYFRYMGSLTTPPCSEGLTWTVFRDPIEASPEQIKRFAALFPNNARPLQDRNRRLLTEAD
jgi:carbonic anhydrase